LPGRNLKQIGDRPQYSKILATADVDGAARNPKGFDVKALAKHVEETGSVKDFPGSESMAAFLVAPDEVVEAVKLRGL
jgi:glutamate dehydrogenase/leucine dehydrogenase